MDTRESQNTDVLSDAIRRKNILSPNDIAVVLPLYIKVRNDNGILKNVSIAYVDSYNGNRVYRKFGRFFDQMHEMFLKNGVSEQDRHAIFRRIAMRVSRFPSKICEMKRLMELTICETHEFLKERKLAQARQALVDRFKDAVKKYMRLTYSLGFNEPSACARFLVERHRIDKYIMSGDFSPILLPFMPELEKYIRDSYENYEMKDAWEIIDGRYFRHRQEYGNMALEIKSRFNKSITNFSDYFDKIYTDIYYRKMLENGGKH